MTTALQPGSTIGVFGGGQLGRMLAQAAKQLGYRVHVFGPEADSPAGQLADRELVAPFEDVEAARRFAGDVDVVTFEFENVPVDALDAVAERAPVRPAPSVLITTQNRLAEKRFLERIGVPIAPYIQLVDEAVLRSLFAQLDGPQVVKTTTLGYDGKGQTLLRPGDVSSLEAAASIVASGEAVMERLIPLQREVSVVAARTEKGDVRAYAPFENSHRHHILDTTLVPARVPKRLVAEAVEMSRAVLEALDLVGLACIEFFVSEDGDLLVNEIAPRTHNSGHLTIEAARTSQFEQQVRAICGLPLGPSNLVSAAAMANLLGHVWSAGEPDWSAARRADVSLHLYGKSEPRPGRKMGHLTALGPTADEAAHRVHQVRDRLALGDGLTGAR